MELIRKEFNLNIEVWKEVLNFQFKQALLKDVIGFIYCDNLTDWYYNFFKKYNTDWKFSKLTKWKSSKLMYYKFLSDFDKIKETIKDKYFFWVFSEEKGNNKSEFWEYIWAICETLGQGYMDISEKYTIEQINYENFWRNYTKVKWIWSKESENMARSMLSDWKIQHMSKTEKESFEKLFDKI